MPVLSLRFNAFSAGLVAAVAVVLAGCSSGSATTDPPAAVASASTSTASPSPSAEEVPESELIPYVKVLYSQDQSEEEFRADFLETEEALAACMNAAGFDYTPRSDAYFDADLALASVGAAPPGDRRWVAENGYGMNVSTVEAAEALNAADPNLEYQSSLSTAEQEAYFLALHGDQNSGGSGTGCGGSTETSEGPLSLEERYAPLVQALNRLYEAIPATDAARSATAEWSSCMADSGYPGLADQTAAWESVPTDGDPRGNPENRRVEVKTALADFDCRETTGYDTVMAKVTYDAETRFFDENHALLAPLIAEAEQRDGR